MVQAPPPGLGVDAHGGPVIDPTANVIALVIAATTRLDDLREMAADHAKTMAAMSERHAQELRTAESARIDANRAIDQANVTRAFEVAAAQAAALATQLTAVVQPIQEDVRILRQVQFKQEGERDSATQKRGINQWMIGAAIAGLAAIVAIVSLIAFIVTH